ncbi:MAG TPA: hypothetical protein VGS07_30225 [Thermoanaerobaculia bacterium]|jgi:hypothetical protein|nr:hypothetical protein [Thermoanaerobaculia bacterium]
MLRYQSGITLCASVLLVSACFAFDQQPLAPETPPPFEIVSIPPGEQIPQVLELRRVERQMGGPDRSIVEGSVSVDRGIAHRLLPTSSVTPILPKGSRLYVIKVDFTLNKLEGKKSCRKMTLLLAVDEPGSTVIDFFPRHLNSSQQIPKSLAVTPSAELIGLQGSQGAFPVDALEPKITGFGKHEHNIYWTFEAAEGRSIAEGARSVFLVLTMPSERAKALLSVEGEADIGSYAFGRWWWPDTSKSDISKLAVPLR